MLDTLTRPRLARDDVTFPLRVHSSIAELAPQVWDGLWDAEASLARHSFLRLCETASEPGTQMRYVTAMRQDRLVGAAAFTAMTVRPEWLATGLAGSMLSGLNRILPGATDLTVAFCGVPTSLGSSCLGLPAGADKAPVVAAILDALETFGANCDAPLLCIKELSPVEERSIGPLLRQAGYVRAPSLPGMAMRIGWPSLDAYRAALRSGYRRQFDANLRRAAQEGLAFSLCPGAEAWPDQVHRLYRNVVDRAPQKLEVLTPAFIAGLLQQDGVSVLRCTRGSETLACAVIQQAGTRLRFLLAGFDHDAASGGHVYVNLLIRVIEAAIHCGARTLTLGQTSYPSKTRLGGHAYLLSFWLKGRRRPYRVLSGLIARYLFPETGVMDRRVFREPEELAR
jgi:hypothetical protein